MKFQTPKGTRDFLPEQNYSRRKVIKTLKDVYLLYGFEPWDGPSFEYLETLTKKSGEEIKDEIYEFEDKAGRKIGLRFELTASLARIIAQNPNLKKPLKLFNIGKVWRYERPQSGRFREFLQADGDIIGVSDMTAEIELLNLAKTALKKLGFIDYQILLSNRKILNGIIENFGLSKKQNQALRLLDKLEKIGEGKVQKELEGKGINSQKSKDLIKFITQRGDNKQKLAQAEKLLSENKEALSGIAELKQILEIIDEPVIDFSLVRGLDYYTGPIFEIKVGEKRQESIAGGGRYDNLIKDYGGKDTPACGLSFGIERLFELLSKQKSKFQSNCQVYVAYLFSELFPEALKVTQKFRKAGINTDLTLQNKNLSKQLEYASAKKIPYTFMIFSNKESKLKDMKKGTEEILSTEEAIKKLMG